MIYAVGFYQEEQWIRRFNQGKQSDWFEPIIEQIITKSLWMPEFGWLRAAAGLQVDNKGKLHVWERSETLWNQLVIKPIFELKTY
jgi:hypothetical protein